MIAVILGVGVVGLSGGSSESAADETASDSLPPTPTAPVPAPTTPPENESSTVAPTTMPPLQRTIGRGVQGDDVRMVQERLAELGFDPGPVDGIFGSLTTQAVWAFEKLVMGTPRSEATGQITPEAWDTLGGDLRILPRRSTNGQANHTEVYLPEQVLAVFHADEPVLISHISSGQLDEHGDPQKYCEEATYDTDAQGRELEEPVTKAVCALAKTPGGVFTYDRQVEGKRVSPLGGMWNPVYFNYGIAVHGAENVPLEPVSHGCVRLPMHISEYFQSTISLGDRILVWNGDKEPEEITEQESLPSFDYPDPDATTTTTTTTIPSASTVAPSSTVERDASAPSTAAPAPSSTSNTTSTTPSSSAPATTTAPGTTITPASTVAADT